MSLREQLDRDLKDAMRAKDTVRLETVRNVRSAVRQRELDEGAELDDDAIVKVIRGLAKQRDEAIAQYREGERDDLVERETAEKAVLDQYLPAAPSAEDVQRVVGEVVDELSASSMKDMGRVMKEALARLGPGADGKQVSAVVKARLSG
ncbi:MAG: GatB/YqeY domain-containing protein [Myxococcales bacterium]|jgi:uncharacterized protein YqeY